MPLLDRDDPRPIHFMGINGAGMALAELCVRRGARVDGCDQSADGAADLRRSPSAAGHDAAHIAGHRALVVSSAIPKDHPEILRARSSGVPVVRRAEALAEATAGGRLVGVAGTHGKSTTTVMTTMALKAGGVDATGVVGARVAAWNGNLSAGADDVFVVEADEYDRSFLALSPNIAVVTNIEADHLDIYRDLADIESAFAQFVRGARWVALCADDPRANALPLPSTAEVIRYGISPEERTDARLVATHIEAGDGRTTFDVHFDGEPAGHVVLGVPGEHNVRNALAALAVGIGGWGLTVGQMAGGFAHFTGAERRSAAWGMSPVIDDYAHHPTELRATLAAARAAFGRRRIVVAFQPHLFTRTRDFASDFASALSGADAVYLADIYPAREQPIAGVTSALIADPMARLGHAPRWTGPRAELAAALAADVRAGDVVLTVGAGDISADARGDRVARAARMKRAARRVALGIAALCIVSVPWWGRAVARHLAFFRVRRVEVDGARYVNPDQIVSRMRVDTMASIWDDVGVLEQRVRQHPSVRSVDIERKLPGTRRPITENLPVASQPAEMGLRGGMAGGDRWLIDPTVADVDFSGARGA